MFEGVIYDSSHIVGLNVILKAIARRRRNKELKLMRSSFKEGPATARNTENQESSKKKDEDDAATQVFHSENKKLKSALSMYDSEKNGQLQSNDTLGIERYDSEQPKLFDQSFKVSTEQDNQNVGQEP